MVDAIPVNARVTIPPPAIEIRAVASSGPGGQHVNKTATKVQMRIDLALVPGLGTDELARLRRVLASRLDESGRLLVVSQATRSQAGNIGEAARRAAGLIRAALVPPKPRRRTRPPPGVRRARLEIKKRRSRRLGDRRVELD